MQPDSSDSRLHFVLQRTPEEIFEPDVVPEAPLVRFVAYARHHRVFGWVRLHEERLTDLINAHQELLLTDVEIENLEDGETHSADRVVIDAGELVAVHASGPRGDASLRHRTRLYPIAFQSGHYLVGGHLHVEPGVDPSLGLRDRPRMVPLTDAWIEYWSGERRVKHAIGIIIVNRDVADSIRIVSDEELLDGMLRPAPDQASASA